MRVDEQILDDRIVLEGPDTGDGPVGFVGWYRREQRVQALTYLTVPPGSPRGLRFLGRERRRGHQLLTLGGVLTQQEGVHRRGVRFAGQPGADRRPCRLRLAGGLVVEVPDDGVEEVAADTPRLTRPRDTDAHARDVGAKA